MLEADFDSQAELLSVTDPDSPEYDKRLNQLESIARIKKMHTEAFPPPAPTGLAGHLANEALVNFGRDVLVTSLILQYEKVNVITSRISMFVRTSRSK